MCVSLCFKGFFVVFGFVVFLIMWCSVFCVVELSEGWDGEFMSCQDLFIVFEGVFIVVVVVIFNVFYFVLCGKEFFLGVGGMFGVWGF